jgi:hypothetical protein
MISHPQTLVTSFSFALTGPGTREQAERLAHEVIPAVRAATASPGTGHW